MQPGRVGWLLEAGSAMERVEGETEEAAVSRYLVALAAAMERDQLPFVNVPNIGQMLHTMLERVGVGRTTKSVTKLFNTDLLTSLNLTNEGNRLVLTTVPDETLAAATADSGSDGEEATSSPGRKRRRKGSTSGLSGAEMREWLLDVASAAQSDKQLPADSSESAVMTVFLTRLAVSMEREGRPLVHMAAIGKNMAEVLEVFGVDRSSAKLLDLIDQDLLATIGLSFGTDTKQALQLVGWIVPEYEGRHRGVGSQQEPARPLSDGPTMGPDMGQDRRAVLR
jgi:hypothetical protein